VTGWLLAAMALLMVSSAKPRRRRKRSRKSGQVLYLDHVDPSDLDRDMLAVLQSMADAVGTITVTSGLRSYDAQADAMAAKMARGEDLHDVYRNDAQIDALLLTPPGEWAAVLAEWSNAGQPISRHLGGRGADVRTRDRSDKDLDRMTRAAERAGANWLVESDHLHIGV
jgi:hypothetical protein